MSNLTPTAKEAKRLYRLGFAIHWLHPKSKRPIGNEWTTGPRKAWKELSSTYQPNFNVGVRLGTPSQFESGYLAVIDVDIKSEEKRHRQEALAALAKLIGKQKGKKCPEVRSGRGNGSRHLYCITSEPFKTFNPAQSLEEIKVRMPSKSPSKKEKEQLSESEIREGWRLSKAWEISLYSEGRQVVLPPSIHPDTNKPYFWQENLIDLESLPVLHFQSHCPKDELETDFLGRPVKRERKGQETVEDFTIDETLDIRWLPDLDENTRKLITLGLWRGKKIEDRSAYLLPAATGLVSAGLDKNSVLTVLTDRSTVLGECSYDHAQTNSRKRAAKWLWNYTVKKVMRDRDPRSAFEGKPIESESLDEDEAASQAESVEADSDWKQYLEMTEKGNVRSTLNNCKTILQNVCASKNIVGRDEFANNDFYLVDTPWRSKKGDAVTDMCIVRIKFFCSERYGVEFGDNLINQALLEIADVNRFHPVRSYLKSLEWDGTPRLETWLQTYAAAQGPESYLKAVSRKILVALVKRVFEPGCQFDQVLILEGDQGVGKSSLLRALTSPWFTDQPLNIGDKDTVLTMQSKWLIELGELASLNRSEVESMKAFVSQRTDRIRAPYGKRVEEYPRQSIFVGSTNLDEYLKDETGNRRFWPVKCVGKLKFKAIERDRDQLFAEAYAYYRLGEPTYLEAEEDNLLALAEQNQRGEIDEWFGAVADVLNGPLFPKRGFEMRQLAGQLDQFGAHRLERSDQQRIGKILKTLGYAKYQENVGDRRKLWAPREWVELRSAAANKADFDRTERLNQENGQNESFEPTLNQLDGSEKKRRKSPPIADFY